MNLEPAWDMVEETNYYRFGWPHCDPEHYRNVFLENRGDVWYMDAGKNPRKWQWEPTAAKTIEEAKALAEAMWRMG